MYTCAVDGDIKNLECDSEQDVLNWLESQSLDLYPDFSGELEFKMINFTLSGDLERVVHWERIQWIRIDSRPFNAQEQCGTWNPVHLGLF